MQKDLGLAAHFYRLAAARHHVAAQYNLAVMMANGKGVKRDLEKALALILIAKQNTGLNPNARLRLNQFQTAIEGIAEQCPNQPHRMAGGKIIWHAHLAGLEIKFAIPKSNM